MNKDFEFTNNTVYEVVILISTTFTAILAYYEEENFEDVMIHMTFGIKSVKQGNLFPISNTCPHF